MYHLGSHFGRYPLAETLTPCRVGLLQMTVRPRLLLAACAFVLASCSPPPPVKIGFIGGLSDRNTDVGLAGNNAVILAVEQFNRDGGLGGRMVELVSRDDAQDPEAARRGAEELVAAGVEAVIGPFTSAMAVATLPVTGRAGVFQISPTITSMSFHGKDDNLFRINRTTRDNAGDYARVLVERGQRRIAVAYDTRNRNFTESWLAEFRAAVPARGGQLAAVVPFESRPDADFPGVVRAMLAGAPDSLFFIAGGLDVARLAQQARRQAPALPIGASEWAATEQLLELGGEVIDGLLIVQNFDRDDVSPRYKAFSEAYFKRFQRNPGYSSVSAYDAATVVLTALRARGPGQTLKQAVLANGPYQGLQQSIAFDRNGDTTRRVFFTEVRGGRYVKLE